MKSVFNISRNEKLLCFAIAAGVLTSIDSAVAQSLNDNNLIETIDQSYFEAFANMRAGIISIARSVFFTLLTFSLVWTAATHVLANGDLPGFLGAFTRFTIVSIFGVWILDNPSFVFDILQGFQEAAASSSGVDIKNASDFWEVGVEVAGLLANQMSRISPTTWLVGAVGVFILWQFTKLAILILKVQIQAYALATGGMILMMFWSADFTRHWTQSYFSWLISVGLKQFFIILMAGVGYVLINTLVLDLIESISLVRVLALFGIVSIYVGLVNEIPSMVDGLLSGAGGNVGGSTNSATQMVSSPTQAAAASTAMATGAAMSVQEASKLASAEGHSGVRNTGATISNLAKAAVSDIGSRSSGNKNTNRGTMGSRMAENLKIQRLTRGSAKNTSAEPPKSSNTISAADDSVDEKKPAESVLSGPLTGAYISGAPGDEQELRDLFSADKTTLSRSEEPV